ncbi:TetR/AcrR family transcriptional regulator [Rhodococcus sp. NPDC003318]|uniref:TetR/AcrR family transcriptional regulator n=1 Tax=Rhodococcus sp. NPDC003318 TaxID=3364503 RepID=UPI0036A065D5
MTARRGRYSAGEKTRIRLIEAAEKLFAQRGYDGVTLAEIRSAAGQSNASAITYYFGSKANLLSAILKHRLPVIKAERDELFRLMDERSGAPSTRDVLWCFVQPLADTLGGDNHYAGLIDRLLDADLVGAAFAAADPDATASGFQVNRVLDAALAELPEGIRRQRVRMVYDSVLRTLARYDRSGTAPDHAELSSLIDAWEGLLHAPTR